MGNTIERRSFELRAQQDKFQLVGRAVSYNVVSSNEICPGLREKIAPGAFRETLDSGKDVLGTMNHDVNRLLCRRANGTLRLNDSAEGLDVVFQLDRNQQAHRDVFAAVQRRDLCEMSFAFMCADDDVTSENYNGERCQVRTVKQAKLVDVSLVAQPFYAGDATFMSARSAAATAEAQRAKLAQLDADFERRERAHKFGMQILESDLQQRSNADWFAPRYASKDELLSDLQEAIDEQESSDCFRAVDACRDSQGEEGALVRGTAICRDLNADDEAFVGFDFEIEPEDKDDERQKVRKEDFFAFGRKLGHAEVSSRRGIRLIGRKRSVTPSETVWVSSLRSTPRFASASAEHVRRLRDRELERRMRSYAGRN